MVEPMRETVIYIVALVAWVIVGVIVTDAMCRNWGGAKVEIEMAEGSK
jgi:hypothetical protein